MAKMINDKKTKLAKEAATTEFGKIVDCFGFNVSNEAKTQTVKMEVNNLPMEIQQEITDSKAFIDKIMSGRISFDEEKEEIVYHLRKSIRTGEDKSVITEEFRFSHFTRAKQKASKIPLTKCNFSTLGDDEQDTLIQAMTGVSDDAILSELETTQFSDLRMIGAYFFN